MNPEIGSAPLTIHGQESDWETISSGSDNSFSNFIPTDTELTIEQPVRKEDLGQLKEIPVSTLAKSKSISWAESILTYSNPNRCYERLIVSITVIK